MGFRSLLVCPATLAHLHSMGCPAASDSERQRRDVVGIVLASDGLDVAYVERWAAALGVLDAWHAVLDEARDA